MSMPTAAWIEPSSDGGDEPPETFNLTLTRDEVEYLFDVMHCDAAEFGDIPQSQSIFLKVRALYGPYLRSVN